jgi:hypothetical protein
MSRGGRGSVVVDEKEVVEVFREVSSPAPPLAPARGGVTGYRSFSVSRICWKAVWGFMNRGGS